MPKGIGWWWVVSLDWPEQQFHEFVDKQSRETLIRMLQETDPNGCWTDELSMLEIGEVTSLETARAQMKTFWKEGQ